MKIDSLSFFTVYNLIIYCIAGSAAKIGKQKIGFFYDFLFVCLFVLSYGVTNEVRGTVFGKNCRVVAP